MSNPRSFCTIAKHELDHPNSFLPSGLRYRGEDLLWTTNAYATWKDTQLIREAATPSAVPEQNTDGNIALPPTMAKISSSKTILPIQYEYIEEYKHAHAILETWAATYPDNPHAESTLNIWRETCDKLLENPNFTQGWHLPAFYPFYSYQCMASIESFFTTNRILHPNKGAFWDKQDFVARTMFSAWEPTYFMVCAAKRTPFPKCLWYHKYQYVHVRKQPQIWTSFFQDSPFATWGRILPDDK
jgi:hypothetical protein